MAYNKSQLRHYSKGSDIIPINPWNKMKKGKQRGKTPKDMDWTTRKYDRNDYDSWIESGYNLGYRINENEVVVDMDPRNYNGEDVEDKLADTFGYFDFEDMVSDVPSVQTGGGGYHLYFNLPEGLDYRTIRETVEDFPGVEFKRKGRQVLCAGSKHPNGEYYTWVNECERKELPASIIGKIERPLPKKTDYSSGQGCLNGDQLRDMVLSKLDPEDYSDNDSWFPLLCASHHATNGEGIEEFVEWSLQDSKYANEENSIRSRWESLSNKEIAYTAGTLIRELKNSGQESKEVKAALSFSSMPDIKDDENSEESEMIETVKEAAREIDVDDIYSTPEGEAGVEGAAISYANDLQQTCSDEDLMTCLRLIKASSSIESVKAQQILISKKILKQSQINKLLKELDSKISDDFALLLSKKTLEKTFNEGRHLINTPAGMLWAFYKTHWIEINDEFLAKLIQSVLHTLKAKMDISYNEISLINQAVKLTRIQVSTMTDRLHTLDMPKSIINCKNGELWIHKDGTHVLKQHNYRSYMINCLDVDYDPSAKCPLFMQTIREIFDLYDDTEDMVRHIGEIMGYMLQPYKNIASWYLFRGPGGDGKSTLIKVLGAILKRALLPGTSKVLAVGTDSADEHVTASLLGKLCITLQELPANYMLKDAGMKLLSENSEMEANPKHKARFNFMYSGSVIMCSNGFPAIKDLSHGMIRRAHIIPFNRQFTAQGNVEDLDRVDNIISSKEEMSGVLNFMLEGIERLRNRGKFQVPKSCESAKEEWLGVANNVVRFVKETIEKTCNPQDSVTSLGLLYGSIYTNWCEENGIDIKNMKKKMTFKKDLEDLGFTIRAGHANQMKVYGGKLKDHIDAEDIL